ncbi:MAG: PAS domain S-box protein [Dehalococcoidia bacterium]|nr:PAS domain S-box protein [Dehalococcoidia bacterium]
MSSGLPLYAGAAAVVLAVALITGILVVLGLETVVPYVLVIVLAGLFLGLWYGIAGTALSCAAFALIVIDPNDGLFSGDYNEVTRLGAAALVGVLSSIIAGGVLRSRHQLAEARGHLLRSRDELDLILQTASDGITVQDREGRLVYANREAARLAGFSSVDDLMAASSAELVARFQLRREDGAELPLSELPGRVALAEGRTAEALVLWNLPGAEAERWSSVKAAPVFDDQGRPAAAINTFQDVTPLKAAERSMRVSEVRLSAIVASATDAIISADSAGHIVVFNSAAEMIFGCTAAEAAGTALDRFIPDGLAGLRASLASAGGESEGSDKRPHSLTTITARRADGSEIPVEATLSGSEAAGMSLSTLIVRDIRERLRTASELSARIDQQAAVAELGQLALADVDIQTLMDESVKRVATSLDVEHAQVLELASSGESLLLRAGVGWREGLVGNVSVSAGTQSQAGYTIASNRPVIVDDLRTEQRFSSPPILFEHGVVSGITVVIGGEPAPFGVLGALKQQRRQFNAEDVAFVQSVANVIAAAVARSRGEQARRESEGKFRKVIEGNPVAMVLANLDGRIMEANDAFLSLVGYSREDVAGGHLFWKSITPPEYFELDARWREELLTVGAFPPYEKQYMHKEGRRIPILVGGALLDENTSAAYVVDLTERQRSEDRLRFLAEASEALSASLDQEQIVEGLAEAAVQRFADCCVVGARGGRGTVYTAAAHVDKAKEQQLRALLRRPLSNVRNPATIALRTGQGVLLSQITDEALQEMALDEEQLDALRRLRLSSAIIVPLLTAGRRSGIVAFGTSGSRRYGRDDLVLAQEIARRGAVAIESADLYREARRAGEEARQRADRLTRLQEVTAALAATLNERDVASVVVEQAVKALQADAGAVVLLKPDARHLGIAASIGYNEASRERWAHFSLNDETPIAETVRNGDLIWFESRAELVARYPNLPDVSDIPRHAMASLPLQRDGVAVGAISVTFFQPHTFSEEDRAFMLALAQQCDQALERGRLYEGELRARTQADEAGARLASIFETSPVGMALWDRERRYVDLNDALAEINGLPREAHIGRTLGDLFSRSDPEFLEMAEGVYVTGEAFHGESFPVSIAARADRQPGYFTFHLLPTLDAHGGVESMLGYVIDVTERVRLELAQRFLADASSILSSSLNLDETLRRLVSLAVPTLADYCQVYLITEGVVSRPAGAHTDPSKETLLEELSSHAVDLESEGRLARVLREGRVDFQPEASAEDIASLTVNPARARLIRRLNPHSFMILPLTSGGKTLGAMYFARSDSSLRYVAADLAMAEETARRAAVAIENARLFEEAERALDLRNQFLSIASHELKTPLTTVKGYTQLLLRRISDTDPALSGEILGLIDREANRMAEMVNDMLDITRIEHGRLELERRSFDLNQAVRESVEQVSIALDHQFDFSLEEGTPAIEVVGDRMRVQQVVTNLLNNAAKYSGERRKALVRLDRRDGEAIVEVQDLGIGIPGEQQPHVFELFFRGANLLGEHRGGMGLGLYISRSIIEAHGGSIGVASEVGQGSTFHFTLPLQHTPAATV